MKEPLFTRRFWVLYVAHFLGAVSILAQNLLPLFIQDLGGDAFDIGLLMPAAVVSGIAARPMIGRVMDLRGRRIAFLLAGAINALGHLSYLLVTDVGPLFYAVRLFHGVGMGGLFAAYFTGAADLVPESRRTEGIAIFGTGGMAAAGIGPLCGELVLRSGGYPVYFWSLFAIAVAALLLTMTISENKRQRPTGDHLPDAAADPSGPSRWGRQGVLPVLTHPGVARLWPVGVAFGLTVGSFSVFIAPFVSAFDLMAASTFFVPYAAASIILRLSLSTLPDRVGPARVMIPALACLGLGAIMVSLFKSNAGLVVGGLLGGLGHGFVFPALASLLLDRSDPGQKGTLLSLFTAAIDTGAMLGSPILGWIARSTGFGVVFFFSGACALAILVYFWVMERKLIGTPATATRVGF